MGSQKSVRRHLEPRLITDDAQGDHVRRVRSERRELLDRIIEAEAIPGPVCTFTNSLFVELTFATAEDAQALDNFAGLMGWLPFYWA